MVKTKTPGIWMETRCASVASVTSQNWVMPENCHQTAHDGLFTGSIATARRHFEAQGWRIIDGDWWCPVCATVLAGAR